MSSVEQLLGEFIELHLSGSNPDPWEFIDRLDGGERDELADLIDAYFVDAPRRPWSLEEFKGSTAEKSFELLRESLRGEAGLWPIVLPRLRDRAELTRTELVRKLSMELGVPDQERKVETYYHGMERGLIRSGGVKRPVLEALAEIIGATSQFLRAAGKPVEWPAWGAESRVFARTAPPPLDEDRGHASGADSGVVAEDRQWDEVDELFRGGTE